MNLEGQAYREDGEKRSSDTVAGFLSSIAIFISLIGLAWHPLRLILPGLALSLIASGMGSGKGRLQFAAVIICCVCFFLGMTIAVALSKPLW